MDGTPDVQDSRGLQLNRHAAKNADPEHAEDRRNDNTDHEELAYCMAFSHTAEKHTDYRSIDEEGAPVLNNPIGKPMILRYQGIHDRRMHPPMIDHVPCRFCPQLAHKLRIPQEDDKNEDGHEDEYLQRGQPLQAPCHAAHTGYGENGTNTDRNNQPDKF